MTTHRTALALTLVVALAATSATPSFAKPNNGAYQRSAEAAKQKSLCRDYKDLYDASVNYMNTLPKNSTAHQEERQNANDTLGSAWKAGCSWAQ